VSGPAVRLADTGDEVITVIVSGLLAAEDFTVLDARPRPEMPRVSVLDGLPSEAVQEALWWQRHIVEVLTGLPPDAREGAVPQPEYDPAGGHADPPGTGQGHRADGRRTPGHASAVAKRRRLILFARWPRIFVSSDRTGGWKHDQYS
jgi:hypothetical protein